MADTLCDFMIAFYWPVWLGIRRDVFTCVGRQSINQSINLNFESGLSSKNYRDRQHKNKQKQATQTSTPMSTQPSIPPGQVTLYDCLIPCGKMTIIRSSDTCIIHEELSICRFTFNWFHGQRQDFCCCLLYTSPSPRD